MPVTGSIKTCLSLPFHAALRGWKQPHQTYNPVGIRQMAPPEHTSDKQGLLLIYRSGRMKGSVCLVGWPVGWRFTHIVVTRWLQAKRRIGSVCRPKTGVPPTVQCNQPS